MIQDADKSCLVVGLKQVKKALAEKRAKKVFLADDCDSALKESVEQLCKQAGIIPERVETMRKLGDECGIEVKASCACVC